MNAKPRRITFYADPVQPEPVASKALLAWAAEAKEAEQRRARIEGAGGMSGRGPAVNEVLRCKAAGMEIDRRAKKSCDMCYRPCDPATLTAHRGAWHICQRPECQTKAARRKLARIRTTD